MTDITDLRDDASGIVMEDLYTGNNDCGQSDLNADLESLNADIQDFHPEPRSDEQAQHAAKTILKLAPQFDFNYKKSPDLDDQPVYYDLSNAECELEDLA